MKRSGIVAASATCLFLLGGVAAFNARAANEAQPQTLTGEVLDLACYVGQGAHGDKHQKCAQKCLDSGTAVGLLVGDKAYLIAAHADDKSYMEVRKMAAQKVKVTGIVSDRGGLPAIAITSVEKAD